VPDHPDREDLAAWQAGALDEPDRDRTASHVAGCPDCGRVVGALGRVRQRLALLDEPELPAGFHDRLAAAVDAERAWQVPRQRPAWYRRPAAWGAAAAVLLFVAGIFSLIRLSNESGSTGSGAATAAPLGNQGDGGYGNGAAGMVPGAPPAPLLVVRVPGEFSPTRLRNAVRASPTALRALRLAERAAPVQPGTVQRAESQPDTRMSGSGASRQPSLAPADQACVDRVAPPGGVRPALIADTRYQGRPARVLVAYVGDSTRLARFWVFPDGGCGRAPLTSGTADLGTG